MREDNYPGFRRMLDDAKSFIEDNWKDDIGAHTAQFVEQIRFELDKAHKTKEELLYLSSEVTGICGAIMNEEEDDEPKRLVLKLKRKL